MKGSVGSASARWAGSPAVSIAAACSRLSTTFGVELAQVVAAGEPPITRHQKLWFWLGVVVFYVATDWPVHDIAEQYKQRRDTIVRGLHDAGWMVENPKAAMYIWAKIPEPYAHLGSLEFAKKLLSDAKVCVSPGIGFGDYGDDHVRFALIENQDRIRQAVRGIKAMFRADGLMPATPARKTSAPHD